VDSSYGQPHLVPMRPRNLSYSYSLKEAGSGPCWDAFGIKNTLPKIDQNFLLFSGSEGRSKGETGGGVKL